MYFILQIIFWLCILGVTHTYFIYPYIVKFFAYNKKDNTIKYELDTDSWPSVAILMAVYNEEKVLENKLESILNSNYPKDLLHVYIGDDGSTDATRSIIEKYQGKIQNLHYTKFGGRNGKPTIINHLEADLKSNNKNFDLYLMTDANVIFDSEMIKKLASHFKNKNIGLVGATVKNIVEKNNTVGQLEEIYISRENVIKHNEGLCNGALMGAFGACFMVRASSFVPSPHNLILDDFYLCMKVHDQQLQCIYDLEAISYEDVPGNMILEFKRKCRISAGNYQNLMIFKSWILKPNTWVGFNFISHKVLRWITPFLVLGGLIIVPILSLHSTFYQAIFYYKFAVLFIFFVDVAFMLLNITFKPIRLLTYFYFMNIALAVGFFNWLKGIKTNAWKSTDRVVVHND